MRHACLPACLPVDATPLITLLIIPPALGAAILDKLTRHGNTGVYEEFSVVVIPYNNKGLVFVFMPDSQVVDGKGNAITHSAGMYLRGVKGTVYENMVAMNMGSLLLIESYLYDMRRKQYYTADASWVTDYATAALGYADLGICEDTITNFVYNPNDGGRLECIVVDRNRYGAFMEHVPLEDIKHLFAADPAKVDSTIYIDTEVSAAAEKLFAQTVEEATSTDKQVMFINRNFIRDHLNVPEGTKRKHGRSTKKDKHGETPRRSSRSKTPPAAPVAAPAAPKAAAAAPKARKAAAAATKAAAAATKAAPPPTTARSLAQARGGQQKAGLEAAELKRIEAEEEVKKLKALLKRKEREAAIDVDAMKLQKVSPAAIKSEPATIKPAPVMGLPVRVPIITGVAAPDPAPAVFPAAIPAEAQAPQMDGSFRPSTIPPQQFPPYSFPPQSYPPQSYPPHLLTTQSFPPQPAPPQPAPPGMTPYDRLRIEFHLANHTQRMESINLMNALRGSFY